MTNGGEFDVDHFIMSMHSRLREVTMFAYGKEIAMGFPWDLLFY